MLLNSQILFSGVLVAKSRPAVYGRIAQSFHWLSAALILIMAPMGLIMVRMADSTLRNSLYRVHVTIGMLVVVLTLARLVWAFLESQPDSPAGIQGRHVWLYKGVHYLFYVILFALGSTGAGMLLISGIGLFPGNVTPQAITQGILPQSGHMLMSRIFMALLAAHLFGIFQYQFTKEDVLNRMGLKLGMGK